MARGPAEHVLDGGERPFPTQAGAHAQVRVTVVEEGADVLGELSGFGTSERTTGHESMMAHWDRS